MRSNPWLLVLLAALGSSASMAADAPRAELELSVAGDLVIDPSGSVREYKLDSGLQPTVAALVEKNLATWRFEPVIVDGRAVVAKTRMNLTIHAMPQGNGDYVLKLQDAGFGGPTARGDVRPPRYPTKAIRSRLGARVLLSVRIDAQGNVVDVHPYQTSLSQHGREAVARRWRTLFEEASIAAVREWKYTPGESLDGRAVGSTVMVPIVFTVTEGPRSKALSAQWRAYAPGPVTPAPWVDADSLAAIDADTLDEGESASLDSKVRLASDVIGKAL
jgi:hypothetical protein